MVCGCSTSADLTSAPIIDMLFTPDNLLERTGGFFWVEQMFVFCKPGEL